MLLSAGLCSEISADKSEGQPTRNMHSDGDRLRHWEFFLLNSAVLAVNPCEAIALSRYSGTHSKRFSSALTNYWAQFFPYTGILGAFAHDPGEKVSYTAKNLCSHSQISAPFPEINLEVSSLQLSLLAGHLATRGHFQIDHIWDLSR